MKRLLITAFLVPFLIFGTVNAAGLKFATNKISNTRPCQYSWTTYSAKVISGKKSVSGAKITIAVHYKTTTHNYSVGKTNSKGGASKRFYISGATVGHKVAVVATASKSGKAVKATSYFTPKKCH